MNHVAGTFLRHAHSIGNLHGSDAPLLPLANHEYPLSECGFEQRIQAGRFFLEQGEEFDVCIHSTALRTKQTLEGVLLINPSVHTKVFENALLNEKYCGIFNELSPQEIMKLYPDQFRCRDRSDFYHFRPNGGQNGADVEVQIRLLEKYVLSRFAGARILIVCHGEWLKLYQKVRHELTVEEYLKLQKNIPYGNCAIIKYTSDSDDFQEPVYPPYLTMSKPRMSRHG